MTTMYQLAVKILDEAEAARDEADKLRDEVARLAAKLNDCREELFETQREA